MQNVGAITAKRNRMGQTKVANEVARTQNYKYRKLNPKILYPKGPMPNSGGIMRSSYSCENRNEIPRALGLRVANHCQN
jgi:hypothetical protein